MSRLDSGTLVYERLHRPVITCPSCGRGMDDPTRCCWCGARRYDALGSAVMLSGVSDVGLRRRIDRCRRAIDALCAWPLGNPGDVGAAHRRLRVTRLAQRLALAEHELRRREAA